MENKSMYDILCGNLSKEERDKINKEIEERLTQFKINETQTLNNTEWKDLVWPSIKRMDVSNEYFRNN